MDITPRMIRFTQIHQYHSGNSEQSERYGNEAEIPLYKSLADHRRRIRSGNKLHRQDQFPQFFTGKFQQCRRFIAVKINDPFHIDPVN
jgi:hypothetical protein